MMPKGMDLHDKSLIRALIQTKHWDKAIFKEYVEKHPEVKQIARDEKKSIEEVVGTVDLSYKWRNNLKYAQDAITRLTILADTLPQNKRQELFEPKPILGFVRSLLGRHSYFMNERTRLQADLSQIEAEFSDKSLIFETTRSNLRGDQRQMYEKTATEEVFRPLSNEMEVIKKKIEVIEQDAIAWNETMLQDHSLAAIASEITRECLDFLVRYYDEHVEDPAMKKIFVELFGNTKNQLDSLLRQVNDKKELVRLMQELKKQKAKERKEKQQVVLPAAPSKSMKTPKTKNIEN